MTQKKPADIESHAFVERLRGGDRDAFAALVGRYHQRLLATARSLLNHADAEEAVQDAWIAAYKALARFEGRSKLSTWLTRIVINEARMRLRRGGREINLDMDDEGRDAMADRFQAGGHWQHPPSDWGGDAPRRPAHPGRASGLHGKDAAGTARQSAPGPGAP